MLWGLCQSGHNRRNQTLNVLLTVSFFAIVARVLFRLLFYLCFLATQTDYLCIYKGIIPPNKHSVAGCCWWYIDKC